MDLVRIKLSEDECIDLGTGSWKNHVSNSKDGTIEFPVNTDRYYEQISKIIENIGAKISVFVYRKIDEYDKEFEVAVAMRSFYHKTEPDERKEDYSIVTIRQESNYTIVTIKDDLHEKKKADKLYMNDLYGKFADKAAAEITAEIDREIINQINTSRGVNLI